MAKSDISTLATQNSRHDLFHLYSIQSQKNKYTPQKVLSKDRILVNSSLNYLFGSFEKDTKDFEVKKLTMNSSDEHKKLLA